MGYNTPLKSARREGPSKAPVTTRASSKPFGTGSRGPGMRFGPLVWTHQTARPEATTRSHERAGARRAWHFRGPCLDRVLPSEG